jgi:RNA polymerase sigma-70 factor (ECF subfamily)
VTAHAAAERAARESYGRLLALLCARGTGVAEAEDALAEAFAVALRSWPADGVPRSPEAWLLVAARRNLGRVARHGAVRRVAEAGLQMLSEELAVRPDFPDERLKLLFVCAHPAIDEAVRTPLMLQTVLGLDAARIAAAFLISPGTMGQRLVRAKLRLREAGITFAVPEPEDWPARVPPVLAAIYAAFGTGWEGESGALEDEAIWLARLLGALLPDAAEALGLLALMLHAHARRAARRDAEGRFVPLDEQDTRRWNADMIQEAEAVLTRAARLGQHGPWQIEAAIQSVHAGRARTGRTEWKVLVLLHDALVALRPTLGARIAQAAAHGQAGDPDHGLALLDALPGPRMAAHQPFWAVRAHLLRLKGDAAAAQSYRRAAGLSMDAAQRDFLLARATARSPSP